MTPDCDFALFGTGLAPLVAAQYLTLQGKSVLLLNPDLDFFLEDSELPLDPFLHGKVTSQRILENTLEQAMELLRPVYPGPVETWSPQMEMEGYHDPSAPHLRQRGRLWISPLSQLESNHKWESLEELYVEASDAHLKPQLLEGLPAIRRFPGVAANADHFRGLYLSKLCDLDISRYRNGILEFIRERLPTDQVVCSVGQIEMTEGGLRYHSNGTWNSVKLNESLLVFWTPRLTQWVMNQSKKLGIPLKSPKGIRIWEQWSLNSKEQPSPGTVGMFENMIVWADFEGMPRFSNHRSSLRDQPETSRLAVLRSGPLVQFRESDSSQTERGWVSNESLGALSHLCYNFLKWSQFSIRSLRAKAIFEWESSDGGQFTQLAPQLKIIHNCDGPIVKILKSVRSICEDKKGD